MIMKKMILCTALLLLFILTDAQNIETAKKMFYYQKYLTASSLLQQTIVNNPNDAPAYFWQVLVLNQMNNMTEAKKLMSNVPSGIINNPYIKIAHGFIALESKDTIAAKQYFNEAIGNERKKDPLVLMAVAEANAASPNGDNLYAIGLLEEVLKKDKKNTEALVAEGDLYRKLLDGSNAFSAYNTATEIDKNDALAYYKLGKIFQSQDNRDMYLMYFNKAIEDDPKFAPAYYQLFYAFYQVSNKIAKEYLDQFIANSEKSTENDYLKIDMYYLLKNYSEEIKIGNQIIDSDGNKTKSRIYKLLAYCYDQQNDLLNADVQIRKYFSADTDPTHYATQDYDLMGKILESKNKMDEVAVWYQKAYLNEKDLVKKLNYTVKLAAFYKKQKDFVNQSYWLKEFYSLKQNPNNIDLFNWGIAEFNAKDYKTADSVFAIYETKYPEQPFGYYWRARSNASIDTAMETGVAVPHYENLIQVASKDINNATNKKWVIQAYGYIAAFKANKEKAYDSSLAYYDKILTLDSANADALKYKEVLEKLVHTHQQSGNKLPEDNKQTLADKKEEKKQ